MKKTAGTQTPALRRFLLPRLDPRYLLRLLIVAAVAIVVFRFVFRPMLVRGESMAPTYQDGQFLFTFCLRYAVSPPAPGDIVTVRLAGPDVLYLKRVVAMEGDAVGFQDGYLFVNGVKQQEPYVKYRNPQWQLPPRVVKPRHVYVIGDNRGTDMEQHRFGQTHVERINGSPLW